MSKKFNVDSSLERDYMEMFHIDADEDFFDNPNDVDAFEPVVSVADGDEIAVEPEPVESIMPPIKKMKATAEKSSDDAGAVNDEAVSKPVRGANADAAAKEKGVKEINNMYGFYITEQQNMALNLLSVTTGRNRSEILREALDNYLEKEVVFSDIMSMVQNTGKKFKK